MEFKSSRELPGQVFLASGNPRMQANPMLASGNPNFQANRSMLTSGHGAWEAFAIGDGISKSAQTPFQLAPRLYIVSLTSSDEMTGEFGKVLRPFVELPINLTFQNSLTSNNNRLRQVWKSESGTDWKWELTVEQLDSGIQATMAAIPFDELGLGRLTWQRIGDWNPFGSNSLKSDKLMLPQLVVSAS